MSLERISLDGFLTRCRPGDKIACDGAGWMPDGWISALVELDTYSPVSHMAEVIASPVGVPEAYMIEAVEHVKMSSIRERFAEVKDNHVWWLRLSDESRAKFNLETYQRFVMAQLNKAYAVKRCSELGLHYLIPFIRPENTVDTQGDWFCSELCTQSDIMTRILPSGLIASCVSPLQECQFAIYAPTYYQVLGDLKEIPGINSVDPLAWGKKTNNMREA